MHSAQIHGVNVIMMYDIIVTDWPIRENNLLCSRLLGYTGAPVCDRVQTPEYPREDVCDKGPGMGLCAMTHGSA